jgi:hypothetical protein
MTQPPVTLTFGSQLEADSFDFLVRTFKSLTVTSVSAESSSFHLYVCVTSYMCLNTKQRL